MIRLNDHVTCAFADDLLMIQDEEGMLVLDAEAQENLLAALRDRDASTEDARACAEDGG